MAKLVLLHAHSGSDLNASLDISAAVASLPNSNPFFSAERPSPYLSPLRSPDHLCTTQGQKTSPPQPKQLRAIPWPSAVPDLPMRRQPTLPPISAEARQAFSRAIFPGVRREIGRLVDGPRLSGAGLEWANKSSAGPRVNNWPCSGSGNGMDRQ